MFDFGVLMQGFIYIHLPENQSLIQVKLCRAGLRDYNGKQESFQRKKALE